MKKISKIWVMILAICMFVTAVPVTATASAKDDATAAYMDFLRAGQYKAYTTKWENSPKEYDLKDINQDGINELLVNSDSNTGWYNVLVFTYDVSINKIVLTKDLQYWETFEYSEKYKAIGCVPYKSTYRYFEKDFYVLKDNQLISDFAIGRVDEVCYIYRAGKEIQISEAEFQTYNSVNTEFAWKLISNIGTFDDVSKDQYYYDPVEWALKEGITNGLTQNTFGPENSCTRGQVVTFLWRALGKPSSSVNKSLFTDISSGEYYYDAVLWAVGEGITTGTSKTTFEPDLSCSRGQIVTFLWRALDEPNSISSKHSFTDISSKEYYYKPVLWAVENKITTGLTTNKFAPDSPCTRGQIATFLYRTFAE